MHCSVHNWLQPQFYFCMFLFLYGTLVSWWIKSIPNESNHFFLYDCGFILVLTVTENNVLDMIPCVMLNLIFSLSAFQNILFAWSYFKQYHRQEVFIWYSCSYFQERHSARFISLCKACNEWNVCTPVKAGSHLCCLGVTLPRKIWRTTVSPSLLKATRFETLALLGVLPNTWWERHTVAWWLRP